MCILNGEKYDIISKLILYTYRTVFLYIINVKSSYRNIIFSPIWWIIVTVFFVGKEYFMCQIDCCCSRESRSFPGRSVTKCS